MSGNVNVTTKFAAQFVKTAILDALPRALELNSSAVISHGIAPEMRASQKNMYEVLYLLLKYLPGPTEKKIIYATVATIDKYSKPFNSP